MAIGSSYKEDVLYLRFMASYRLAINSHIYKKESRLNDAVKAHQRYKRNFPESENLKDTENLLEELNEEINIVIAQKTETNGL